MIKSVLERLKSFELSKNRTFLPILENDAHSGEKSRFMFFYLKSPDEG